MQRILAKLWTVFLRLLTETCVGRSYSAHPCCALQPAPNTDALGDSTSDDENLFEPKQTSTGTGTGADTSSPDALNAADSSRVAIDDSLLSKWGEPGQTEQLRNRFVTGALLHGLVGCVV